MQLTDLRIQLQSWGDNKGQYTGVANFASDLGTIGVILSPEVTTNFLALAGDLLIAHIEVAAMGLQKSVDTAVACALKNQRQPKEIAHAVANTIKMLEQGKKP